MKFSQVKGPSHNIHNCLLPHSFQLIIHSPLPNIVLVLKYQPVDALASALPMTTHTNKTGLAVLMVRSGIGHHT